MRSPAETLERAARGTALAILTWLLVRSLGREPGEAATTGVDSLARPLVRWSTAAPPTRVHLRVDGRSSPSPTQRDWLAALAGTGARVTWEARGVLPVAAVADPVADPAGGTLVRAAAPAGATAILADAAGDLDSAKAASGGGGVQFLARSAPDVVTIRTGGAPGPRAAVPDSLVLGRLLLLGRVGWESKFVAAALEERGWRVDVQLALSPKGDVVQGVGAGGGLAIDTGRFAAVIALDSSALAAAPQLVRYVRAGGGLIAAAPVAAAAALAPLRVGAPGAAVAAVEPFEPATLEPRRELALLPILLRGDAVALERRDGLVAVAARRVGRGRVVVTGYDDTWRWRMAGAGDAVEQHRAWWAGLVAGVAHAGRVARAPTRTAALDEAPLAHWIDRLGPASPPASGPRARVRPAWLFALLVAALLLEWASRRQRGAR